MSKRRKVNSTKRPNKSAKGRPNSTRWQSQEGDSQVVRDTEKNNTFGGNAIEWYSRYPNLLLGAGQIPYPYKPGMAVTLGTYRLADYATTDPESFPYGIPGILKINWIPSLGYSNSQTSPISIVGKELYAKVREKFSGSLDADAPDFVVYLMALDSIFSYIACLKRIYRCINAYSPENLYTPDGILDAMGFSTEQILDLRQNKIQLFQNINELIFMTKKFKCPRIMDVFNRHVWLNDHIYTDAPTPNSQFYMFWQRSWFQFKMQTVPSTSSITAGGLTQVSPWSSLPSISVANYLFTFGRNLIDALAASDDGYLISGYLMRAYEGYPDFTVDELLLDETLIPKYNEEVLNEIQNLHTLPDGVGAVQCEVFQEPDQNIIVCEPTVAIAANSVPINYNWHGTNVRFTSRSDAPTVAENVINSRLMTYLETPKAQSSGGFLAGIISCTEIILSMNLYMPNVQSGDPYLPYTVRSEMDVNLFSGADTNALDDLTALFALSQWDWAPLILPFLFGTNKKATPVLVGDIHNFTVTDVATLKNINKVCLYSLFNAFSV